jgi:hypothetical protein
MPIIIEEKCGKNCEGREKEQKKLHKRVIFDQQFVIILKIQTNYFEVFTGLSVFVCVCVRKLESTFSVSHNLI